MGFREDIEELADRSGSFTASPAHVFRELRVILNRYPAEPKPEPWAHPLTQIGRK